MVGRAVSAPQWLTARWSVVVVGALVVLPHLVAGQQAVDLGEIVQNLIFPDEEVLGGVSSLMDRSSRVDLEHQSCGERTVCEVLSNRRVSLDDETGEETLIHDVGLLRTAVEVTGNALYDVSQPLLRALPGIGPAIARIENRSFFDIVIDAIDSLLIGGARILAGRRFARQIEEIGPLRSAVDFIGPKLIPPKVNYYAKIMDLAVDLTGIYNRDRGSYKYLRAGTLGYFQGESGICDVLEADDICPDYAWSVLSSGVDNKVPRIFRGQIHGIGSTRSSIEPLMEEGIGLKDLAKPKRLLCKLDGLFEMLTGHIDNKEEPYIEYEYLYEEFDAQIINAKKGGNFTDAQDSDFDYDDEGSSPTEENGDDEDEALKEAKMKALEKGDFEIVDKSGKKLKKIRIEKMTTMKRFQSYCQQESRKMLKLKEEKNKVGDDEEEDESTADALVLVKDALESSGDSDTEETDAEDTTTVEPEPTTLEPNRQPRFTLQDFDRKRSIFVDKIIEEVVEGEEEDFVASILEPLDEFAGAVTKIENIRSRKGNSAVMVELDSTEYRDKLFNKYKASTKRSELKYRLKKPTYNFFQLLLKARRL